MHPPAARRLLLAGLALALGAACARSPVTQIILSVPEPEVDVEEVRFLVTGPGLGEGRLARAAVAGAASFPLTLALVHEAGALGPYRAQATGVRGGERVVAEASHEDLFFKRGQIQRVELRLRPVGARDGGADAARDAPGPADASLDAAGVDRSPPPDGPADLAAAPDAGIDVAEAPPPDAGADVVPDVVACPRACQPCTRTGCGTGGAACVCAAGCPCLVTCAPGTDCEVRCRDRDTTCTVNAARGANVTLSCQPGARCTFLAAGSQNVTGFCRESFCEFDCTGTSNCRITCDDRARCLVRCAGASNCRFETCKAAVSACGDGLIACGGCP